MTWISIENFQTSDHSFIHTYISLPKFKIIRETRKVRKLRGLNSSNCHISFTSKPRIFKRKQKHDHSFLYITNNAVSRLELED